MMLLEKCDLSKVKYLEKCGISKLKFQKNVLYYMQLLGKDGDPLETKCSSGSYKLEIRR